MWVCSYTLACVNLLLFTGELSCGLFSIIIVYGSLRPCMLILPSNVLTAHFFARVSIQELLSIGLVVLVLGFAAGIVSVETLQAPEAA